MKRWFTKSFLLMLALLVGSELGVRIFFARSLSGRFEYGYNPDSGFVEQGGQVKLVRAGGRRFYPQTFSGEPAPGVFRIMVIGDSVARGPSMQAAYAYRLGEFLRASGVAAESLNLAIPGYGARRNQIVLQRILQYQPSLIVFHLNNSNEYEDERDWKVAERLKTWHPSNWPMKSMVFARAYELNNKMMYRRWVPPEVRNPGNLINDENELQASQDEAKVGRWNQFVAEKLAEDVALVRKAKVPMLIVTQARCLRPANGPVEVSEAGLEAMVRPLLGDGIFLVSMKDTLARANPSEVFSDSSHLRAAGHDLVAQAIVQKLREKNLVALQK